MSEFTKDSLSEDKLRYSLIDPAFLAEVTSVMSNGAKKYSVDNWQKCHDVSLYIDALFRHIEAWRQGEKNDPEWDCHHLAHAACNLMFLHHFDKREQHVTQQHESPRRTTSSKASSYRK